MYPEYDQRHQLWTCTINVHNVCSAPVFWEVPTTVKLVLKRYATTMHPSFIARVHFNRDILILIFGLLTALLAFYRLYKPIGGTVIRNAAGSGKVWASVDRLEKNRFIYSQKSWFRTTKEVLEPQPTWSLRKQNVQLCKLLMAEK